MLMISILLWVFATPLVAFFNAEGLVLKIGVQSLTQNVFFSFGMVMSQAFNGAGDTKTPTKINFMVYWVFQLPLAYLLSVVLNFGPEGVFITMVSSISLAALIFVRSFNQGKWKNTEI